MAQLRRRRARLAALADAPATQRAYASDWADFRGWCDAAGRQPLPASAETLGLYATDLLERGSVATCERRLAGISRVHRVGGEEPAMEAAREVLRGARRERGSLHPGAKRALTVPELRRMVMLPDETARGRRDRAILTVGFAGAFRRSELVALEMSDLVFEKRGVVITVRHGKTDAAGVGREVGIPRGRDAAVCPVRGLRSWIRRRGARPGPVFCAIDAYGRPRDAVPIAGEVVAARLVRAAQLAGVDVAGLGGHSLRAGCITSAAAAGASLAAIMGRSGHRSVATVMGYVRPSTLFDLDPLRGVL